VAGADSLDTTVVATSDGRQDDIIARYGQTEESDIYRGSESNVLDRMYGAASEIDIDVVVRITADCPLIDPSTIDAVIESLLRNDADYATNILERTFPRGLDVEAFTSESFERVHSKATESHHREHVTPYYRENPNEFDLASVTSDQVFEDSQFCERSDLRLTLDEADDYEVLREIYENVQYDDILPIRDAIKYVDENNLMDINAAIEQKNL